MNIPISELNSMPRLEAAERAVERIVDRAVLDSKFERALSVMWMGVEFKQRQLTLDEIDEFITKQVFQEAA